MTSLAYKKIIKSYGALVLAIYILVIAIEFILRFNGESLFLYYGETPITTRDFAILLFCISLPIIMLIVVVKKVFVFKKKLHKYESHVIQAIEEDFKRNDRMGDIYFTRYCVIVHQCRIGAPVIFDYIPYNEIDKIVVNKNNKQLDNQILEIVINNNSRKNIFAAMVRPVNNDDIEYINSRIKDFKNNCGFIKFNTDEQNDSLSRGEHSYLLNQIKSSPLPLVFFDIAIIMVYCLGFLGILKLPGIILNVFSGLDNVQAHSEFWPSLLTIVWALFIVAVTILFSIKLIIKQIKYFKEENVNNININLYMKTWCVSIFAVAFIIFISYVYISTENIICKLIENIGKIL